VMDIVVNRNAFGRQVDSFETDLTISGLDGGAFHAIFIRAPLATKVGEGVTILAQLDEHRIVAAREKYWLATAFHPELTQDPRLHAYFLDMVVNCR